MEQASRPGVRRERRDAPASAVDRAFARLGFLLQQRFARALADEAPAAADGTPLADLRYRLRRDGFRAEHVRAGFAACAASGIQAPPPALAAALRLVQGGIVELEDRGQRDQALLLAAFARALHDGTVHVLAPGEGAAQRLAGVLAPALAPLGMAVGCLRRNMDGAARAAAYASPIVCAPLRELAQDYLRGLVTDLGSALVDDADLALVDDTVTPVVIAGDAEPPADRLMYEQAIELARSLAAGADFSLERGRVRLAEAARDVLERLVAPLGGAWAVRERREGLVELALAALHCLRRDADYRVVDARVVFPPPAEGEQAGLPDEHLQRLVEVKEGVPFGARREVRARLSLPRFVRRYLHLAGIAADCRGLEQELWSLYTLKTALAGRRAPAPLPAARVFATAAQRRKAVIEAVRAAAGAEVLVAVRSPAEAEALRPALGDVALVVFSPARGVAPRRTAGDAELVLAELLDSRRHVAWLRRAWGAERCTVHASLDDAALADTALAGVLRLATGEEGELSPTAARRALPMLQGAVERAGRALREDTAAREQAMEDLLALSGQRN